MTPRHYTTQSVFAFISAFHAEHGYGPSQREIAEACFIGRSAVLPHLIKLEAWGCITLEEGKARSLRPLMTEVEVETYIQGLKKPEQKTGQMSGQKDRNE